MWPLEDFSGGSNDEDLTIAECNILCRVIKLLMDIREDINKYIRDVLIPLQQRGEMPKTQEDENTSRQYYYSELVKQIFTILGNTIANPARKFRLEVMKFDIFNLFIFFMSSEFIFKDEKFCDLVSWFLASATLDLDPACFDLANGEKIENGKKWANGNMFMEGIWKLLQTEDLNTQEQTLTVIKHLTTFDGD